MKIERGDIVLYKYREDFPIFILAFSADDLWVEGVCINDGDYHPSGTNLSAPRHKIVLLKK